MIEHPGELQDVRPADRSVSSRRAALVPRGDAALGLGDDGDGPILTTDEPGCRETVLDGANGYLLSAHNVPQLTAGSREVHCDPGLIAAMGWDSRCIASEKYDVRKVNEVILEARRLTR